ncbi:protein FAM98A isoform X1 [Drosophila subobscura]|uniref:protein FAM98A isoform X1 n=1 Tax=Drosophila subobscura TaxID=7241 RepID=UPI00155B3B7A|nr:protein FAM98A isoform X1 [Drosophila subobscura]
MDLELDVVDYLQALSYDGNCLQQEELAKALDNGIGDEDLRAVIFWLAHELHVLRKTDEHVTSSKKDHDEFAIELSLLLTELSCSYSKLVLGPVSERFESRDSLLQLLDYLTSELMFTKISLKTQPMGPPCKKSKTETGVETTVLQLVKDLQLGELPKIINAKAMFDKITHRLEQRIGQTNRGVLSEPLLSLKKPLSDVQWRMLEALHVDLDNEYNLRRQMMLTRLEATIQSFQWSESMRNREHEIMELFQFKLKELENLKYGGNETNIVALLAARADLAVIEKTSSANVRKNTASKIQKHMIGSVPDRGGRANEHAPPPPEMPSWQQQRASGPQGRGGGGGGGRGGGNLGGGGRGRGGGRGGSAVGGDNNWQQQHRDRDNSRDRNRDQQWTNGSGRVQGSGWNPQGVREVGRPRGGGRGGGRSRVGGQHQGDGYQ